MPLPLHLSPLGLSPSSHCGTQPCPAPPCPGQVSWDPRVGLGHPPVVSAFQSSTWMRASSSTRSWASSGEEGAGATAFLLPLGKRALGASTALASPSAELSLGDCHGLWVRTCPQQAAKGLEAWSPRQGPSWLPECLCHTQAGRLSRLVASAEPAPRLTQPGAPSTLPTPSAGPQPVRRPPAGCPGILAAAAGWAGAPGWLLA